MSAPGAEVAAFPGRWHADPPTSLLRPEAAADWAAALGLLAGQQAPVECVFTGRVRGFQGTNGLREVCTLPRCGRPKTAGACPVHGRNSSKGAWRVQAKTMVRVEHVHGPTSPADPAPVPGIDRWLHRGLASVVFWDHVVVATAAQTVGDEEAAQLTVAALQELANRSATADVTGIAVERALVGQTIHGYGWLVPVPRVVRSDGETEAGWAVLMVASL